MTKKSPATTGLSALLCASAALATTAVSAQQVTLYGIVDAAVEHVSNVGAAGASITRMPTATTGLPSRWGMRGTEDLGGGLKTVFTLESGFGSDSGVLNQGGRMFGRQAFVGLSGNWGTVALGRQYTMLFWSLLDADVIGPMTFSLGSLDNYLPNARADNALSYRAKFSDLSIGASYSFGRDTANPVPNNPGGTNCGGEVANDSSACREWSVMAKFDQANWGIAAALDQLNGGAGSWTALGLTSSALSDKRTTVNGYVKFGGLKIGAGLVHRNNEGSATTPRSDLYFIGASYPVTPAFVVDAQYSQLKFKDSGNKALMGVLRGTYNLSKTTAVYAAAGRINNDGTLAISVSGGAGGSNPLAGGSQTGLVTGVRVIF
ncbi:porin [Variovorax sp. HJSM1_2]|uniref:porin n=1 Tax=Variovorax sp. HJSM1_2 TaxID=3366263 RepID=UPI003BD68A0F